MTENQKVSKTYTKLPTLSPAPSMELIFSDDKFVNPTSKKNSLATTQGFLSRRTTKEINLQLKTTEISEGVSSPENVLHLSKSINEEFDFLSARNFAVSPNARSSEQTIVGILRKKNSSEHPVNDFYLRSLGNTKYNSDMGTTTKQKFYAPSSRLTQQSFYETGHMTRLTEKKSVLSETVTNDLALLASGKSPKKRFVEELNASIKFYFNDKKEFHKVFDDIDIANYCLEEITERLKCYRAEMGTMLEKIQSLYKKIFKRFLDVAMKSERQIEESTKVNVKETLETIERLKSDVYTADDKLKNYRKLFEAQDSQAKMQEFNITSLQNEIQLLYKMLQKETHFEPLRDDEEESAEKKAKMKYLKIAADLEERVTNFQESIFNLEAEQHKKESSIKEMNHLLKAMLKSAKQDQATQVNESELLATVHELVNKEKDAITSHDVNYQAATGVNTDSPINKKVVQIERMSGVDTAELQNLKDIKIKETSGSPTTDRLLTETQYGQKLTMNDVKNLVQSISDNWNLPLNMVVFLENVTKNKDAAGVLPWNFFKKIIYDIYMDRLATATEVQNSLISTYIPLSEYTCIYFLKKYDLRRTAELKLLEFLASLRYYSAHWQRALTFANLANICSLKFSANNMFTPMDKFDPFMQHYFFFCYQKATSDSSILYETADSVTYYPKNKHDNLVEECLFYLTEEQRKLFSQNNKKNIRFYTEVDEGFDLDKLLHMFCEEYIEARSRNINKISKSLSTYFNDDKGETVLSLEEILAMTKSVLNTEASPLPGHAYPQALTVARSFLFSLTSGRNSFSITINNILTAFARFGLDSPFPFINVSKAPMGANSPSMTAIPDDILFSPRGGGAGPRKNVKQMTTARFSIPTNNPSLQNSGKSPRTKGDDTNDSADKLDPGEQTHTNKERRRTAIKPLAVVTPEASNQIKIDGASMMFTQHFSILREMRSQIHQLNKLVKIEHEKDVIMKHFEQVAHALDSACQFLSFPIVS